LKIVLPLQWRRAMDRTNAASESLNRRALPGRPKCAAKRRAILEAAKQLFLSQGFERTSLDSIAAAANVSKLTLYSHFRDKSDLHLQALRSRCEELTSACLPVMNQKGVGDRLLAVAHALFESMTRPEAIAVYRSLVAGTRWRERVPERYWGAVPQHLFDEIVQMLCREQARGAIAIQHPRRAASHFMSLVKGDLHEHLLFERVTGLDAQSVGEHLRDAIAVFYRAYAPPLRKPARESKHRPIQEPTSTCMTENQK
jgi:TetR/AcrR family transcriptional repressor of mexJK operon